VFRSLVSAALLGLATASFADGPGSRIRASPAVPQPPTGAAERDAQRCDALRGEAKERCLRELRAAMRGAERAPHQGPNPETTGMGAGAGSSGPEATGMGSGAGSGSTSGKR
jgi:hypothetical protein